MREELFLGFSASRYPQSHCLSVSDSVSVCLSVSFIVSLSHFLSLFHYFIFFHCFTFLFSTTFPFSAASPSSYSSTSPFLPVSFPSPEISRPPFPIDWLSPRHPVQSSSPRRPSGRRRPSPPTAPSSFIAHLVAASLPLLPFLPALDMVDKLRVMTGIMTLTHIPDGDLPPGSSLLAGDSHSPFPLRLPSLHLAPPFANMVDISPWVALEVILTLYRQSFRDGGTATPRGMF